MLVKLADKIALETILENITDGFVFFNADQIVLYWNRQAEVLLGMSRHEAVGRNIRDCFPEEAGRNFYNRCKKAEREQAAIRFEEYFERIGAWLEVNACPSSEGLAIYFRDISEQKKKEEAHKEISQRFDYILKATSDVISDFDVVANKSQWYGDNFRELLGYDPPVEPGAWVENVHPDDLHLIKDAFVLALQTGKDGFTNTYRIKRSDGSYAVVRDRSYIIKNEEGRAVRVIGAMEDITHQRDAENALIENEKKYRSLFNNAPMPQWIHDRDTLQILDANEAALWFYGYSRTELLAMTVLDLRVENTREAFNAALKENKRSGAHNLLSQHRRKDGSLAVVEIKATTIDYNGIMARLVTVLDITEKEAAKQALIKSEESNRRLFDYAPLAIYICEKATLQIIRVNDAAIRQYGYTEEEFLRLTPYDLRSAEEHTSLRLSLESLEKSGQVSKVVATHRTKGGQALIVELNAALIDYNDQECLMVSIADITTEIRLEEKLTELKVSEQRRITKAQIQAQETERDLIGRELHDNVNQQLTTAKLYMDLAREREDLRLKLVEKSEIILNNTINEIRYLSKTLIPPQLKDMGLLPALTELVDSFRTAEKFEISLQYNGVLDSIEDDLKIGLYRVVQEGLTNVSKYAEATAVWIELSLDDDIISLEVRDNGKGFDTQKKGAGVGLTNIRNRIEVYNGMVEVCSSVGEGCRLLVSVPYEGLHKKHQAESMRILIAEDDADDEEDLRQAFAKRSPESRLTFMPNGQELLNYITKAKDNELPDLIVLDYNMPLLNGLETLQALQSHNRFSRIPKIIYSTSSNKRHREKSIAALATAYIEKSIALDDIVANVDQMISFAGKG